MKKYYIKKNIIGFIVGVILCTGTFVYAAVTFPSNEVSYDNTESGLSSTNVKGAIDELYTECTKEPPAGETIIDSAGLEKDPYECRYFFTGANPNNYITFNGEDAGWRIISVECDGTIKIMRTANINTNNNITWDSSNSNNWARPATLNTYLNGTYYNSLDSTAQSQIVTHDFGIGAVKYGENNLQTTINEENKTKWNGKIALVTASEYIRSNSNQIGCGTMNQLWNAVACYYTTWMYTFDYWWFTLTPRPDSSSLVFDVNTDNGNFMNNNANDARGAIRPALYLSSDIKITGGTGTKSDPYVVS